MCFADELLQGTAAQRDPARSENLLFAVSRALSFLLASLVWCDIKSPQGGRPHHNSRPIRTLAFSCINTPGVRHIIAGPVYRRQESSQSLSDATRVCDAFFEQLRSGISYQSLVQGLV